MKQNPGQWSGQILWFLGCEILGMVAKTTGAESKNSTVIKLETASSFTTSIPCPPILIHCWMQSKENITATRSLAGGRSMKNDRISLWHTQAVSIFYYLVRKICLWVSSCAEKRWQIFWTLVESWSVTKLFWLQQGPRIFQLCQLA